MTNFSVIDDAASLLCDEDEELCFDDLVAGGFDAPDPNLRESDPFDHFPVRTDESFAMMVEKEREFLPRDDYPLRLRSGELESRFRSEAYDWISKAHDHFGFGPLSLCLSMNYLDRFLSLYDLPKDKAWAVQILALACLSIAVKMEETTVPLPIYLQVGEPKFLFEGKSIQRMELLVLTTLQWKMNAILPCSYVDYFLSKLLDSNPTIPEVSVERSFELIQSAIRSLEFLEYKPSEIAFAATIIVAGEIRSIVIDQTVSDFTHLQKDRIVNCIELMRVLQTSQMGGGPGRLSLGQAPSTLPQSPIGVLEAKCFSNSSRSCDGTPVASRSPANSSLHDTSGNNIIDEDCPDAKRRRLDQTITISGGNSSKS